MPLIRFKRRQAHVNGIKFSINGLNFNSFKEACDFYQISYNVVMSRINTHNFSIQKAFDTKIKKINKAEAIFINNLKFNSFNAACKFYKKEFKTVKERISKGWSLEEAFDLKSRPKNLATCKGSIYIIENTVNNKVYIGLTTQAIFSRFKRHKEEALNGSDTKFHKALRRHGFSKFKIKLINKCNNRHELAKLEVKYIKKYNSIKQGYNTASGGGGTGERYGNPISYEGIVYNSRQALADYLGIKMTTLYYRLKNNLPLHVKSNRKSAKFGIKYKNEFYRSLYELSNKINIPETTLRRRLNNNCCLNGPPNMTGKKGYYKGTVVYN